MPVTLDCGEGATFSCLEGTQSIPGPESLQATPSTCCFSSPSPFPCGISKNDPPTHPPGTRSNPCFSDILQSVAGFSLVITEKGCFSRPQQ